MADVLDQMWACLNCNTTFRLGHGFLSKTCHNAIDCPKCHSPNTEPADGAIKDVPEYFGEIGTRN